MGAELAFWLQRTKCMQNKNELKNCRIALQRKTLLIVDKNVGQNPASLRDLDQWKVKNSLNLSQKKNGSHTESVHC